MTTLQDLLRAEGILPTSYEHTPGLIGVPLSSYTPEEVRWLWPGWLPLGKVCLLDGDPKTGKSTLTVDLAARISVGNTMPDGQASDTNGRRHVLICNTEDGPADTILPRLLAAQGNPEQVTLLGHDSTVTLPEAVSDIEATAEARQSVLLILDPLMALFGSNISSYNDQEVRGALAPLAAMAQRLKMTVLLVRHLNKSQSGNALYRGGGSIGISGAARSILLVGRDPGSREDCVLSSVACNLSKPPASLRYSVTTGALGASKILWHGQCGYSADDLVAPRLQAATLPVMQDAEQFLMAALATGPTLATDLIAQAAEQGISESTLRDVKKRRNIQSDKRKDGWWWSYIP